MDENCRMALRGTMARRNAPQWTAGSACVCFPGRIHIGRVMRTNIEIDDELLTAAMAATGLPTKRATVEEALRILVLRHRRKQAITDMAGLGWEGDLNAMREGRAVKPGR